MPTSSDVIAVLCADIHLSAKPPVARSAEPDWFEAMRRPLSQLRALSSKYDAPIVCAGDVFDAWRSPPELVNFAIDDLPPMFAVPGQHDLPFHAYKDLRKSAFSTLMRTGTITLIEPGVPYQVPGSSLVLHGVPWEHDIPKVKRVKGAIHLAVVHAYCWRGSASYPGAPAEREYVAYKAKLAGYHAAVFGDNHKGFLTMAGECHLLNCGGFMRRKIDEVDSRPSVGLLHADGSISVERLDCSADKFLSRDLEVKFHEEEGLKLGDFVRDLETLGGERLDFEEALRHYLSNYEVSEQARQIILQSLRHD
jgi:hypothetical protein